MNKDTVEIRNGPPDLLPTTPAEVPEVLRTSAWDRKTEGAISTVEMTTEALTSCDYHQFGASLRTSRPVMLSDQGLRNHVKFLGEVGSALVAIANEGRLHNFSRAEQESARVRAGNVARSKLNTLAHLLKTALAEEQRRVELRRPSRDGPEQGSSDRIAQLEQRVADLEARLT